MAQRKMNEERFIQSPMIATWLPAGTLFVLLTYSAACCCAQDPHVAYVYPAGCQRGQSCEVIVGGQHLKDATEIFIAGPGRQCEHHQMVSSADCRRIQQFADEAFASSRNADGQQP